MWAAQFIRFNEPRLWINSGGLGSMGFGLPVGHRRADGQPRQAGVRHRAATAASRCRIPELATIVNHGLPVKIIVMNNGYLGMVRQWQELFYNNRLSAVELDGFPDAEKLAGAYGFKGRTVDKPARAAPRRSKTPCDEPGPVPAQREGVAVRERLPDGARRRRHQRNGARPAASRCAVPASR